jgi:HK97 family phage major capsid protein
MKISDEEFTNTVKDKVGEVVGETVSEILAEIGPEYLKDQLKEHLQDAVAELKAQMPPKDPEVDAGEEKANEFKTAGEYLTAVYKARAGRGVDNRLTYLNSKGQIGQIEKTAGHMQIGDDSQGGFLVPEIYRNELYMLALESSIVRPRATVIPMTTDSLKIPYVNDTNHTSTVFGGVAWTWTAEREAKTATKPTFGQMEFTPHKMAGLTYSSNELLADSAIALVPLIRRMFGEAWAYGEDDAFLVGTGAGQPLGIQNCGCMINVLRNTANRVMVEDLAEMWSRLQPTSKRNAFWVINPTVLPELIELGSGNAADASGKNLVWINNMAEAHPVRILGRPVLESEKMQALGTAGDIGLYDFRYYLIGDRQPITIDASTHVAFTTDETCWRFVLRVAGMCWPQAALTRRRGGNTQSPFVQLSANTS